MSYRVTPLQRRIDVLTECDLPFDRVSPVVCDDLRHKLQRCLQPLHKWQDISDLDGPGVRAVLSSLPISADAAVLLYWPYENEGIVTTYRVLQERLEDLWLPSAEDLVVFDEAGTAPLLHIDHEEVVHY